MKKTVIGIDISKKTLDWCIMEGSEIAGYHKTMNSVDDIVRMLSDVLEPTGNVPQKYFLSSRACKGILRRADKRGKQIPPALRTALETVAYQAPCAHQEPGLTGLAPLATS